MTKKLPVAQKKTKKAASKEQPIRSVYATNSLRFAPSPEKLNKLRSSKDDWGFFAMTENFSHAHAAVLRKTLPVRGF
jgi:hypothetical protein